MNVDKTYWGSDLPLPLSPTDLDIDIFKTLIIKMLETPINITITYVNEFSNNKFEEFISKII
jgi:hypothetical protein